MLRILARSSTRSVESRRTFVSTVLLTRQYENKSLAELRKEAQQRGLPYSGTKATLITRISMHDSTHVLDDTPSPKSRPSPSSPSARGLSTTPPRPAEPSALPSAGSSQETFHIRMPDISQPPTEAPIQIPFVPDFWDSSRVNAAEGRHELALPSDVPKLITVASASTHHAGGPVHSLEQAFEGENSSPEASSPTDAKASSSSPSTKQGIWRDLADDLGLPSSFTLSNPNQLAEAASEAYSSDTKYKFKSRPLDAEEKKGAWVLLGALVGSYAVSKIVT